MLRIMNTKISKGYICVVRVLINTIKSSIKSLTIQSP